MLTRTLATLTLLLALSGGIDPAPAGDTHLDGARAAHRARILGVDDGDDIGGCREVPQAADPTVPAACTGEGQP